MRAYEQTLGAHPDAKLVIGGSVTFGVERETPYIREVRELAETIKRKHGTEIQFTGSLHHDRELPAWFQRATIFSCPSLFHEPFGLVNAEAMACATPVVGTNRGGVPEVVNGGGITVDPENCQQFAAELSRLLCSPELCRRMGVEGLERSRNVFNWRVIAQEWKALLQSMCA